MIIPQREGENPVKKKKKIAHPHKQGEGRRDDQDQEGAGEVKKSQDANWRLKNSLSDCIYQNDKTSL